MRELSIELENFLSWFCKDHEDIFVYVFFFPHEVWARLMYLCQISYGDNKVELMSHFELKYTRLSTIKIVVNSWFHR